MIAPIRFITHTFIDFFGITQPTPKQERQVEWFICGLLALILLGTALVFWVVLVGFGR